MSDLISVMIAFLSTAGIVGGGILSDLKLDSVLMNTNSIHVLPKEIGSNRGKRWTDWQYSSGVTFASIASRMKLLKSLPCGP